MPLKIASVTPRSLAAKFGIGEGDTILSINAMPVNDFFDLEYYASDYKLEIKLTDTGGKTKQVTILRETAKPLGIEPVPYKNRRCRNHCVFCFIDQLPPGLRPSLYEKDDDYLYSYVFGNYITLNNLSQKELNRIVDQHLSPLYVSVHSTDPTLRKGMMRHRGDFDLLGVLKRLSAQGIAFHLQLVIVPDYNDGAELEKSVNDLLDDSVNALSIGIVPVGLTRYREKLTPLKPFDVFLASRTLDLIDGIRHHSDIVYAADELYVLAGRPLPELDYYGEFPQLENGIGMLRLLRTNFARKKRSFVKDLQAMGHDYLFLCSRAAESTIRPLTEEINAALKKERIRVQSVKSDFFGEQISVSGLLTASDILDQHTATRGECVVLPSNIFNHEGQTLDGYSQVELKAALKRELLIVDQLFESWDWQ